MFSNFNNQQIKITFSFTSIINFPNPEKMHIKIYFSLDLINPTSLNQIIKKIIKNGFFLSSFSFCYFIPFFSPSNIIFHIWNILFLIQNSPVLSRCNYLSTLPHLLYIYVYICRRYIDICTYIYIKYIDEYMGEYTTRIMHGLIG